MPRWELLLGVSISERNTGLPGQDTHAYIAVRKRRERSTKVPDYLIEWGRSSGGLCAQLRRQHRPWTRTLNEWRNEASRNAVLCPLHSFMDWASVLTREWSERMTGKLGQVGSAYSDGGSSLTPVRHLNRGGRFIIHSWPRGSLSLSQREASVVGQSPTAVSTQDETVVGRFYTVQHFTLDQRKTVP